MTSIWESVEMIGSNHGGSHETSFWIQTVIENSAVSGFTSWSAVHGTWLTLAQPHWCPYGSESTIERRCYLQRVPARQRVRAGVGQRSPGQERQRRSPSFGRRRSEEVIELDDVQLLNSSTCLGFHSPRWKRTLILSHRSFDWREFV